VVVINGLAIWLALAERSPVFKKDPDGWCVSIIELPRPDGPQEGHKESDGHEHTHPNEDQKDRH
jgi:hypothetical protein